MVRLIDEKKLIEELKFQIKNCETYGHSDIYLDLEMAKGFIELLKQPKVGEWIPVEERLPEQKELLQDYLVTFEYYRYGEYDCMYKTIGIGTFSKISHEFTFINGQTGWTNLNVLAWQPLPKPYEVKEK